MKLILKFKRLFRVYQNLDDKENYEKTKNCVTTQCLT